MHIPDGILTPAVLITGGVLVAGILPIGVKKVQKDFDQSAIPKMGVMAAFIFAAQMINFPILGAASGHLIGGALSAILFGFWPATIIMTTIVALQALLFGDGGITVLGVNIFNMAILAPAVAAFTYKFLTKVRTPQSVSIFIASFLSVIATAVLVGIELGFSEVTSFSNALTIIVVWHLLIGIGEGLITMAILPFAYKSNFGRQQVNGKPLKKIWIAVWLVIAVIIGGFISLLASAMPDGFEKTAEDIGVLDKAKTILEAPFSDYAIPWASGNWSAIVAGIIGVLITAVVFVILAKLIRKTK